LLCIANSLLFIITNTNIILYDCPVILAAPLPPLAPTAPHHQHSGFDVDSKVRMVYSNRDFIVFTVLSICKNEHTIAIVTMVFLIYAILLQISTFVLYIFIVDSPYKDHND
jgi:hypothetical protein